MNRDNAVLGVWRSLIPDVKYQVERTWERGVRRVHIRNKL